MGYLRTNYRITGKELDFTALGGGVLQGSWGSGAGGIRPYGGFIMGSVDAAYSAGGVVDIDPALVISAFYGSTYGTIIGSGYKIFPIVVRQMGTASVNTYQWSICGSAAGDSGVYIKGYGFSDIGTIVTGPSGNAHFVWAGFIITGP